MTKESKGLSSLLQNEEQDVWEEPEWRGDAPCDQAVIASDGKRCTMLAYIGRRLTHEVEQLGREAVTSGLEMPPGIWVVKVSVTYHGDYYGACDTDIDFGDHRPLTSIEWDALNEDFIGGDVWDPSRWQVGKEPLSADPDPELPDGW